MEDRTRAFLLMSLLLVSIAIAAACSRTVPLGKPVVVRTVEGQVFSYVQTGAVYHLVVKDSAGYRAGLKEVCGTEVCTVQRVGELYEIRREAP